MSDSNPTLWLIMLGFVPQPNLRDICVDIYHQTKNLWEYPSERRNILT
ncbi:MAG: hypothetical protein AAF378_19470 [Cyanobacteria bacterium P01_A01_bin.84]